jgi:hypothetical protein
MFGFFLSYLISVKALWDLGSDPFGRSGTSLLCAGSGSTILATNP